MLLARVNRYNVAAIGKETESRTISLSRALCVVNSYARFIFRRKIISDIDRCLTLR